MDDLLNQDYPHSLTEILLIDSGSIDKTKSIMDEFAKKHNDYIRVVVLDNPKKIQSSGWNVALKNFSCDVLIRIDAHTKIPFDFVSKNITNLSNGENVSGGLRPCIIENKSKWGDILLRTENSLFGSSVSKSRHSTEKQYVKSMFHAAYKRQVLEKVGFFNERLLRTEDNEFHYRVRKAGFKLCYDPSIVSYQYARSSLKKMIKQKFGNGYWIGLTIGVCPNCISVYHLVPFVFLISLLIFFILCVFGLFMPVILLSSLYGIFAILNSFLSQIGRKFNAFVFLMPFLFLILHLSYGMGTLVAFFKLPFKVKQLRGK